MPRFHRIAVAFAALLTAGCYDSRFGEPDGGASGEPATETIAALRALYAGTPFTVTGDIVVAGRVTTSDRAENFYRTLCIEDNEAGLEVMAGIDHLHNDFPTGCRVTLRLKGLTVAESRGVLQVGRPPAAGSGYATDYIGSQPALAAVLVRSGESLNTPSPALRRIPELTPALCGTLIRIDGLRYTPEDLSASTWSGYKRFADSDDNIVYTYVRPYARFADADVPAGTVSLTGILQYDAAGDGRYILKPRDESAGLSLSLLLAGCDKATEPGFAETPEASQHTVAYLKSLCDGRASIAVTQDVTIRGFITANDLFGEFDRTIVVEDASGGISIADHPSLADDYPFGAIATVRCNGLTLCNYGGKIELGAEPGDYGAGAIPREELSRHIRVTLPEEGESHRAAPLTFGEVEPRHIDTRVRFDGVRFAEPGKTWCDTDPETGRTVATERTILDAEGNEFTVRSAATCAYAKEPLPSGTGSLYGIIDYFAGKYTLRVTNREIVFSRTATPYAAHPEWQTPDPGVREPHATAATPPRACLSTAECSAPRPTK